MAIYISGKRVDAVARESVPVKPNLFPDAPGRDRLTPRDHKSKPEPKSTPVKSAADRELDKAIKAAAKEEAYQRRLAAISRRYEARLARCRETAASCSTLQEWRENHGADYSWSRTNGPAGFHKEITAHMIIGSICWARNTAKVKRAD